MHIKAILNGVILSCEDGNLTLTFFMVGFNTILCSLNGVKFKAMTFTETVAVNDEILDQRTNGHVNAHLTFFRYIIHNCETRKGATSIFKCSIAANSVVYDRIWPNFELIQALIYAIFPNISI